MGGKCQKTSWIFFDSHCIIPAAAPVVKPEKGLELHILQLLRQGLIVIELQAKAAITIAIRLRFDSSNWHHDSKSYVNEGMNLYQTTFYFGSV